MSNPIEDAKNASRDEHGTNRSVDYKYTNLSFLDRAYPIFNETWIIKACEHLSRTSKWKDSPRMSLVARARDGIILQSFPTHGPSWHSENTTGTRIFESLSLWVIRNLSDPPPEISTIPQGTQDGAIFPWTRTRFEIAYNNDLLRFITSSGTQSIGPAESGNGIQRWIARENEIGTLIEHAWSHPIIETVNFIFHADTREFGPYRPNSRESGSYLGGTAPYLEQQSQ